MNLKSQLFIQRKYFLLKMVCGLVCVGLWVGGFRTISIPKSIYTHARMCARTYVVGVYVIVSLELGVCRAFLDILV